MKKTIFLFKNNAHVNSTLNRITIDRAPHQQSTLISQCIDSSNNSTDNALRRKHCQIRPLLVMEMWMFKRNEWRIESTALYIFYALFDDVLTASPKLQYSEYTTTSLAISWMIWSLYLCISWYTNNLKFSDYDSTYIFCIYLGDAFVFKFLFYWLVTVSLYCLCNSCLYVFVFGYVRFF